VSPAAGERGARTNIDKGCDVAGLNESLNALMGIDGAQVDERVGRRRQFVAHLTDLILGADHLQFDTIGPAPEGVIESELRVDRHDMIQVNAVSPLAADITERTAHHDAPARNAIHERDFSGDVDAIKPRIMIGEFQKNKIVGHGARRGAIRHAAAHGGAYAFIDVDVVLNVGVIGGNAQFPILACGIVPAGRKADGVSFFRFDVEVADIAVAVPEPAVHAHRHGVG